MHDIRQKEMKNYQLDNSHNQLTRVSKNRNFKSVKKHKFMIIETRKRIASWMECVAKYNCKEDKWEKSRYRNYLKIHAFQW